MHSELNTRQDPLWYKTAMEGLHQICTATPGPNGPDIDKILQLGQNIFGLEIGIISEIYKNHYRIHRVTENSLGFHANQMFELGETICKRVSETKETIHLNDLGEDSEFSKHPIHTDAKISCYIGTPIYVREKVYGTLCFSNLSKREFKLDFSDQMILELMAKALGLMIEKSTHNGQRDFFLRKLGHEMRSPLNGILGFCEILNDEIDDPEHKEIFDIIARSSLSLEDRINDLRVFTGLNSEPSLGKSSLSIKASVKKTLTEFTPVFPEVNQWVKNDLPVEEKTILSPPTFLAIIKYIVKDCLNRRRDSKEITLTWLDTDCGGKLIIEDSGPQPSQDVFDIFEKSRYFFSYLQDEKLKGLSLDLVMAKLLCDQLDINLRLIPKESGVIFSLEGIS